MTSARGEIGIGTLIIFIALVLVVAIAAGVTINSAGIFREKAIEVEGQGRGSISTGVDVIEVSATDGMDEDIEDFYAIISLSPGAEPMRISEAIVTQSLNDYTLDVDYREGADSVNDVFTGYYTATDYPFERRDVAFSDPVPSGFYDRFPSPATSAAMVGKIAVAIVLVESDGSTDPNTENWTTAEDTHAINATKEALNWWSRIEPRGAVRHTFEIYRGVETGYEPITRTPAEHELWVNETIDALGFPAGSSTSDRVRQFADDLRRRMNAHWAYVLFVADSSHTPGGFGGGPTAGFAYTHGPYAVVGTNTLQSLPALVAHETGHVFGALDEYTSACTCTDTGGIFSIENGNCEEPGTCVVNETSIMRSGSDTVEAYRQERASVFSLAHMGMIDSDRDYLPDPVDIYFEGDADMDISNGTVRALARDGYHVPPNPVGFYSVRYLQEGKMHRDGLLQNGDLIKLSFESPRPVRDDEDVTLTFIPKSGSLTRTEFITPEVISTNKMYLYP